MSSFVKRLRRHHALILGDVTHQYPIIIKVKELKGIHTAGETQYFFKPKNVPGAPDSTTPRLLPDNVQAVAAFPVVIEHHTALPQQPALPMPEPRLPSPEDAAMLARVQKLWPDVVAHIRDRSAFLGAVLVAGKPARLQDQMLSISFAARDGFHREMLEEPEYRALVEKELSRILRQPVTITCQGPDARGGAAEMA
jgi:hypothetical protein